MNKHLRAVLLITLRVISGGLLLWAGVTKVGDLPPFVETVGAYGMLPEVLVMPFAISVPYLEVILGALLVLGFWVRTSAICTLLLLCSFALALGVNIYRGTDLSCGCFGLSNTERSLEVALLQDIVLMGAVFILYLAKRMPFSLDQFFANKK